ncbi:MAG: hypothetical protein ACOX3Y_06145 [Clostridia bacterium]
MTNNSRRVLPLPIPPVFSLLFLLMFITAFSCYPVNIITYAAAVTYRQKFKRALDRNQRARASTAKRIKGTAGNTTPPRGRVLQYTGLLTAWTGARAEKSLDACWLLK